MRKRSPLDVLFPGTRRRILAATLLDPERVWYLSDLARKLRVPPSSLQRELAALAGAEILSLSVNGNRTYYQVNRDNPVFPELRGLILKTAGLRDVIGDALKPFADKVDVAFIYGSFAKGAEHAGSDVDLMVIGRLTLSELAPTLRNVEERLRRSVNPSAYTPQEFAKKLAAGHHFVNSVFNDKKIFIHGDTDVLETALDLEPDQGPCHKQTRARRPSIRDRS
jgi:predicted nucleotidyltransferase